MKMEKIQTSRKEIQEEAVQKPRMMQNLVGYIIPERHVLCTRRAFQEYIGVGQIFCLGFTTQ